MSVLHRRRRTGAPHLSDPPVSRESLLCVANFPANTGYAWDFIEGLYAGLANRLARRGVATQVAYPSIESPPAALRGSAAEPVVLDFRPESWAGLRALASFIRRNNVRALYLTDRAVWHPVYPMLRFLGVRWIVVHDHTSGERTAPAGPRRWIKHLLRRIPGSLADVVIGVSDYVVRRQIEMDLVPTQRVHRIWNSLPVPPGDPSAALRTRRALGLRPDRPVIVCAGRASPEKGVAHLLRAFDQLVRELSPEEVRPALVFLGDGPFLGELRALRERLSSREDILLLGYRRDAARILAGADICVVPSLWQEAFGLSALEPMTRGVPVIASRVGGIPEIVVHGETGVLVAAGDEAELWRALRRLLSNPEERRRLAANGRRRARTHFAREDKLDRLVALVEKGFLPPGAARRAPADPARPVPV